MSVMKLEFSYAGESLLKKSLPKVCGSRGDN